VVKIEWDLLHRSHLFSIKELMKGNLFVHVPYWKFSEVKEKLLEYLVPIEIYFCASDLDKTPLEKIKKDLSPLLEKGVYFTLHAPFMDLNLGSVDYKIRQVTLERFKELLPLLDFLKPKTLVIHSGFDKWRYGGAVKEWLQRASESLKELMGFLPEDLKVAIENVFDEDPYVISSLIEMTSHPRLGYCFDIGHYLIFSKVKLSDWFDTLGEHLIEVHLHDNKGDADSHLGLGKGIAPLSEIFGFIEKLHPLPLLIIEAHSEEDVMISFEYLSKHYPHLIGNL